MATITLYKDKVNGVGSFLDDIIKSSNNIDVQMATLRNTLHGVDSSTCNLQDTVDKISSSSKSEKEKVEDLKKLNSKLTDFIETTRKREDSARREINKEKKEFYTRYNYLKPDCEKNGLEHLVDACEAAWEWCQEHWESILKIVAAALLVVALVLLTVATAGTCWAVIFGLGAVGAATGFITGIGKGVNSYLKGESDDLFDSIASKTFEDTFKGAASGIADGIATVVPGGIVLKTLVRFGAGEILQVGASTLVSMVNDGNSFDEAFKDGFISGTASNVVDTLSFVVGGGTTDVPKNQILQYASREQMQKDVYNDIVRDALDEALGDIGKDFTKSVLTGFDGLDDFNSSILENIMSGKWNEIIPSITGNLNVIPVTWERLQNTTSYVKDIATSPGIREMTRDIVSSATNISDAVNSIVIEPLVENVIMNVPVFL